MSRFGLDDKRYSTISRYVIATALVLAVVANVGVYLPKILTALAGAGAWLLAVVNPLVVGGLAACLLWPAVESLDTLLSRVRPLSSADRARHVLSVVAVVLLAVAVLAVVVSVLLAFVTDSVRSVSLGNLAELADYVARSMSHAYDGIVRAATTLGFSKVELEDAASAVAGVFGTSGGSIGQTVSDGVDAVRDFVTNGALAVIFCVYFLIDAHNLATYWDRTLRSLMGTRAYGYLHAFALDVRCAFAGYMRGQFIDAMLMGIAVTIALEVVGVRYAVHRGRRPHARARGRRARRHPVRGRPDRKPQDPGRFRRGAPHPRDSRPYRRRQGGRRRRHVRRRPVRRPRKDLLREVRGLAPSRSTWPGATRGINVH